VSALKKYIVLPGSLRTPLAGAREIGPADPNEKVTVTVLLRHRTGDQPLVNADVFTQPIQKRPLLSRSEFEQRHGAEPESIARLEAFARERGLTVKERSVARRTVILSGTVAAMTAAFRVELKEYQHSAGRYRGRTGPLHIPADLDHVIEGILGLDNRPQSKPHFRRLRKQVNARSDTASLSYTPAQMAALYDFPTGVDGSGECIALIELGGGFNSSDLRNYWRYLNITVMPNVSAVSVGSGSNSPTKDPTGPDGGVMLDIVVAGSIAPRAKIVVYFTENTDAGFLNAVTTAIHDKVNKPSIVCISWGGPECSWTVQAMRAIHQAFEAAAAIGVTVCVAAGDDGSTDGVDDGLNHVDFPASSPNALACGGTSLVASGNTIAIETVWNQLANGNGATGGGVTESLIFSLPKWQAALGVPPSANSGFLGRGVPDVAGNADPYRGYIIRVNGKSDVIGGTGAAASLWAGLIALINQKLGKPLGYINPVLALHAGNPEGFHEITSGNNGAYHAGPGWNACAGHGTPSGNELATLFAQGATARILSVRVPAPAPPPSAGAAGGSAKPPALYSVASHPAPRFEVPGRLLVDNVHFTLTGQNVLGAGRACELLFWVHVEQQKAAVLEGASAALGLPISEMSVKSEGPYPLQRGSRLSVRMKIEGLRCLDSHKWITWTGEIGSTAFVVEVPANASEGTYAGSASIRLSGCEIAKMSFVVRVGPPRLDLGEIPSHTTAHRSAFASYASQDRVEVLNRVQGMEAAYKGLNVFVDVAALRSGQNWERELSQRVSDADVFYLFWCRHASKSEWVSKEWHWALQAKGEDFIDPIPLETPEFAPAPQELAAKHFNDPLLAFIAAAGGGHSRDNAPSDALRLGAKTRLSRSRSR
jgi:kumamolisin